MKKKSPVFVCSIAVLCLLNLSTVHGQTLGGLVNSSLKTNFKISFGKKKKKLADSSSTVGAATTTVSEKPIRSAKAKCLSGDCQTGQGVQECADYKYEGSFKDGLFEGRGTYVFYTGRLKGTVYQGNFSNNKFNGHGRETFPKGGWFQYYDGDFVNGLWEGQGTFVSWNGDYYRGPFRNNQPGGFGIRTFHGYPKIGVYDDGQELDYTQGIKLEVLKHHLDTAFAKLVLCDCLTPTPIVIPGIGLGTVNYDLVKVSSGEKVGETSDIDVVSKNIATDGYINNTGHNIYIKAYFYHHFTSRTTDEEYFDESFVVLPGEETLGNFRSFPEAGVDLHQWVTQKIVYLGQYVEKADAINCKTKPKPKPKK